jgi:hypothetical protein
VGRGVSGGGVGGGAQEGSKKGPKPPTAIKRPLQQAGRSSKRDLVPGETWAGG